MSSSPIGVLFVCHANLCRSPLAEGIFAAMVRERGLGDRFEIDSAGCWAEQGLTPHPNSMEIAARNGLALGDFVGRSRVVVPDDLHRFDHVLAMDRSNLADLQRLRRLSAFGPVTAGKARIRLLRHVVDPKAEGPTADVPDPVRRALDAYGDTWTILSLACARLLDELAPP